MYDPVTLSLLHRELWIDKTAEYLARVPTMKDLPAKAATEEGKQFYADIVSVAFCARHAEHFFVESKFLELVDYAASALPKDIMYDQTWLLAEAGWIELETPLNLDGTEFNIICWRPLDVGKPSIKFHCLRLSPERAVGKLLMLSVGMYHGESLSDVVHRALSSPPPEEELARVGVLTKTILTLFHLMSERLTVALPQSLRANVKSKLASKGYATFEAPKLITLRRGHQERQEAVEGGREYQCQWHVRGHWRRQPYRSNGEVRPVFIEAYIKGPEDKPLKPVQHPVFIARR